MAYEGWFRLGGNEIVNNERARGYSQTAACPMFWLKGPRCDTLRDALGDAPYVHGNIPDAPWYDLSMPDVSSRFYGVFALSAVGLKDSTRSASVTESIDDGAQIGRTRKGSRQVRIRAILLARGSDALEYGTAWLNASLDPGACGQHGTGCGTTDLEYLAACPPPRGTVSGQTWAESRRNLFPNPAVASLDGFSENTGQVSMTYTGTAARFTFTTTSAIGITVTGYIPAVGESVRYLVRARASRTIQARQRVRAANGPLVELTTAWQWFDLSTNAGSGSANQSGLLVAAGVGAPGDWVEIDRVLIARAPDIGDWFSGNSAEVPPRRYSWLGAPDDSVSIEETQQPFERAETDEEYDARVAPLRRFLHNVAVTSGPYERELMNVGDFYGQVFEWTVTAGRPWVYSATRDVDLPVTPTIVIQDTPYNLVPYPSAELAGADVTAATNFSANPSVETNATGWVSGASAGVTAGMLTSGRVTGELQAVGTSSFRVVFTATGTGTTGGFYAQQEVDLTARPAGARVSINCWAAELLMAGTPVRTPIELTAYWRATAGGATLRQDALGTIPVNGGALSVKSLEPPAGANFVLVRAMARFTSWTADTVLRLYVDALAVTVP